MKLSLLTAARDYRERHKLALGYVIFFGGVPSGWTDALTRPDEWRPGCIAIGADGNTWQAEGGDCDRGARVWAPNRMSAFFVEAMLWDASKPLEDRPLVEDEI